MRKLRGDRSAEIGGESSDAAWRGRIRESRLLRIVHRLFCGSLFLTPHKMRSDSSSDHIFPSQIARGTLAPRAVPISISSEPLVRIDPHIIAPRHWRRARNKVAKTILGASDDQSDPRQHNRQDRRQRMVPWCHVAAGTVMRQPSRGWYSDALVAKAYDPKEMRAIPQALWMRLIFLSVLVQN